MRTLVSTAKTRLRAHEGRVEYDYRKQALYGNAPQRWPEELKSNDNRLERVILSRIVVSDE